MPIPLNLDWTKIKKEINRLSDLEVLKTEIQKVREEVKNFDYQGFLSPSAQQRVKDFEKRYNKLMKTVGSAQRQIDREFNKLFRQVQKHKDTAEDRIALLKKLAEEQKNKIDKVAKDFSGNTSPKKGKKKKKASSKRTTTKVTKKKTAKKTSRRKKKA